MWKVVVTLGNEPFLARVCKFMVALTVGVKGEGVSLSLLYPLAAEAHRGRILLGHKVLIHLRRSDPTGVVVLLKYLLRVEAGKAGVAEVTQALWPSYHSPFHSPVTKNV